MVNEILCSDVIAFDVETSGLERSDEVVTVSVSWLERDKSIKSRSFHTDRLVTGESGELIDLERILNQTLFNPDHPGFVLFHNASFDVTRLLKRFKPEFTKRKIQFHKDFCSLIGDTMALSRLHYSSKFVSHNDPDGLRPHGLKYLLKQLYPERYKGSHNTPMTLEGATNGLNIRFADLNKVLTYNEADTVATIEVYQALISLISQDEWDYFLKYEIPHTKNLIHLNWYGVEIDMTRLLQYEDECIDSMNVLSRNIYQIVGRSFNIDSQKILATSLFNNPRITYRPYKELSGFSEKVRPFGVTDKGSVKVDIDTLKAKMHQVRSIDDKSSFVTVVQDVIHYLELSKNLSKIRTLKNHVVYVEGKYFIFSNISASTKSGRVAASSPNLLGLPKKFIKNKFGNESEDELEFINKSAREFIFAPSGYVLARIDISGLDLGVLAQGTNRYAVMQGRKFYWTQFLQKYDGVSADPHFSILKKLKINIKGTDIFKSIFSEFEPYLKTKNIDNYFASKVVDIDGKDGIYFINIKTHEVEPVHLPSDTFKKESKRIRDFSKKLNLATSYLMGSATLAQDLTELFEEPFSEVEAQKILDKFYEEFREIRLFQDDIGNKIYRQGYVDTLFGRKFYADSWDNLGRAKSNPVNTVELIYYYQKRYWYIKGENLYSTYKNPIYDLKIQDKKFGLDFKHISIIMELDNDIFKQKDALNIKRSFTRKSENNLEESSNFELTRIAMSSEIDIEIRAQSLSSDGRVLLCNLISEKGFTVPEKGIVFYRTLFSDPSSQYFKKYTPLLKSVKKFFPMYCQGIANTVAVSVLTDVRERIEEELPEAQLLLFVHDEIITLIPDNDFYRKKIEEILVSSVENQIKKAPFEVPFSGEFKIMKSYGEDE